MKTVNKIHVLVQIFNAICIIIVTYDVLAHFKIRTALINQFCDGTIGGCHYKVENIYGFYHNLGTLFSYFSGNSNFMYLIGQLLTFVIYSAVIWTIFNIYYKIKSSQNKHKTRA